MDPSVLDEDRPGAFALAFQTTRDLPYIPYIYSVWPREESGFYLQCARRLRIAFLIKYERLFRTVHLNETNPMGSTHLRCSSAGLRCLAVLFILAIHGSTSVW